MHLHCKKYHKTEFLNRIESQRKYSFVTQLEIYIEEFMKIIKAIIEKTETGYSAFCTELIFSGNGKTIEEAKNDLEQKLDSHKRGLDCTSCQIYNVVNLKYKIEYKNNF